MGAKPSEIAYLSGVYSSFQGQLNNTSSNSLYQALNQLHTWSIIKKEIIYLQDRMN